MVEMAECVVCGAEFAREKKTGRKQIVCSEECKIIRRREQCKASFHKIYHNNEAYRNKRKKDMAEVEGNRRRKKRMEKVDELVNEIMQAETDEERAAILNQKVLLRKEC